MSELTPEIAADVVAACQAGAEEAAGALSRAFDAELTLAVGEAGTFDNAEPPAGLDGHGLAIVMIFGEVGALVLLPFNSGLLPPWVEMPDATGESKLSTLAQELSMLLVPETLFADDFQAGWVVDLKDACTRGGVADGAGLVPLTLTAGDKSADVTLVWPVTKPKEALASEVPPDESAAAPPATTTDESAAEQAAMHQPVPQASGANPPRFSRNISDLSQLPKYSRSLLRVEVPVSVCLASKKQPIGEITKLGPGAIITFEKSCDDLIQLTVGDEPIALGEAVKVGEKFGLQITEMILPDESFKALRRDVG